MVRVFGRRQTLPDGTPLYKSEIKVFVQEDANGRGDWKKVKNYKTWWPSTWDEDKIWKKIAEASNNIIEIEGNRLQGLTSEGIKIEMRLDKMANISTAYITK